MLNYDDLYLLTSKLNILYVEDDINFKEETCDILNTLFNQVDICNNGEEGLTQYKKYKQDTNQYYDLVISDINMPKLNGVELTKEIYKINEEQAIIIISAHNEAGYLLEFVNMGIEQFLVKPLDLDKAMEVFYNTSLNVIKHKEQKRLDIQYDIVKISDIYTWNQNEALLYRKDKLVNLTHKERLLMNLFIKNGNKISSLDEIFSTLWDDIYFANNHSLKCIVSRLRKKIPEQEIVNISKVGYKLVF